MSDPSLPTDTVDIVFHDNFVPQLEAGNYTISLSQSLANVPDASIGSQTRSFVVSAPQFTLDPSEIHAVQPPENACGQFADCLPHVVLDTMALPWERALSGAPDGTPWLALLVFQDNELIGGSSSVTRSIATTVGGFQAGIAGAFTPTIAKADDIDDALPCQYLQCSTATFAAIAPRLDELRFLTHVRHVDLGDAPLPASGQRPPTGQQAVVMANRFPLPSPAGTSQGAKVIVHLVSLEGLESVLEGPAGSSADFGGADTIALLSLASWTFQALPDQAENFAGLMQGLTAATEPWLQRSSASLSGGTSASQQVARTRLDAGYVALSYHVRSGERSFAWFRGPLAAELPALLDPGARPLRSADAAVIYDEASGVFDLSLAAAWQIGRALALADRDFSAQILDLRKTTRRLTDELFETLVVQGLADPSSAESSAVAVGEAVEAAFVAFVAGDLLALIGGPPPGASPPPSPSPTPTDLQASLAAFLTSPHVQDRVREATQADVEPLARWVARLQLLEGLPFHHLVPDPAMLPTESIRFFYLDPNWIEAAVDGALSLGLQSSRDLACDAVLGETIRAAARVELRAWRGTRLGHAPPPASDGELRISGFLMRSQIVSGWPDLSVRGFDADAKRLKLLRLDRLSDSVLLCLFDGVPSKLTLSQPQVGPQFGVAVNANGFGAIDLRNYDASASPALGASIGQLEIRDMSGATDGTMRPGSGGRVLDIDPLLDAIATQLELDTPLTAKPTLTPAQFALQMIKSPLQQTFTPPSST